MDFRIGREILFGEGEVAGIDDDGEIRAAGELVGGVNGIVKAFVEMGGEGGGKMRSGGKAEDADFVRVDVPFSGALANDAEGALGVLQSGGGFGERTGIG